MVPLRETSNDATSPSRSRIHDRSPAVSRRMAASLAAMCKLTDAVVAALGAGVITPASGPALTSFGSICTPRLSRGSATPSWLTMNENSVVVVRAAKRTSPPMAPVAGRTARARWPGTKHKSAAAHGCKGCDAPPADASQRSANSSALGLLAVTRKVAMSPSTASPSNTGATLSMKRSSSSVIAPRAEDAVSERVAAPRLATPGSKFTVKCRSAWFSSLVAFAVGTKMTTVCEPCGIVKTPSRASISPAATGFTGASADTEYGTVVSAVAVAPPKLIVNDAVAPSVTGAASATDAISVSSGWSRIMARNAAMPNEPNTGVSYSMTVPSST